jgi:hypothetical protein
MVNPSVRAATERDAALASHRLGHLGLDRGIPLESEGLADAALKELSSATLEGSDREVIKAHVEAILKTRYPTIYKYLPKS